MSRKLVLLIVIAALTALMVTFATAGSGVAQIAKKKVGVGGPPDFACKINEKNGRIICPGPPETK